jgi:hypothetical protein
MAFITLRRSAVRANFNAGDTPAGYMTRGVPMSLTVTTHDSPYALAPETARLHADVATEYRFRIVQPNGTPVTSFVESMRSRCT